jgi:hypothetical protein
MDNDRIKLLRLLAERLERLHVDSAWARRAYGTRGSVIKALASADEGHPPSNETLDLLIEKSFELLSRAAKDIPDVDELRRKWLASQGK